MTSATRDIAIAAEQAATRIAALIRETPLEYSPLFSRETGAEIYLKLENLQRTGSFKLRGASNRLMTLTPAERAAGCVAASSLEGGRANPGVSAAGLRCGRARISGRSSCSPV